jgi:hypothetical protein
MSEPSADDALEQAVRRLEQALGRAISEIRAALAQTNDAADLEDEPEKGAA